MLAAAEALFAAHGFQAVSVRDITAAAGVNLASVNYHFGSKDALLFEIFRRRTVELNRERARRLHEATDAAGGRPQPAAIMHALFAPPLRWLDPRHERRTALQFLFRARSEGTQEMQAALTGDVTHLRRFVDALCACRPELPRVEAVWRLHFALGMLRNNRPPEFERLAALSDDQAEPQDVDALLARMVAFATAGFMA